MYKTFGEIWTVIFFRYASGHTDRQTDSLIAILRASTGGEVTNAGLRRIDQSDVRQQQQQQQYLGLASLFFSRYYYFLHHPYT